MAVRVTSSQGSFKNGNIEEGISPSVSSPLLTISCCCGYLYCDPSSSVLSPSSYSPSTVGVNSSPLPFSSRTSVDIPDSATSSFDQVLSGLLSSSTSFIFAAKSISVAGIGTLSFPSLIFK
jgi:hypothetical protein